MIKMTDTNEKMKQEPKGEKEKRRIWLGGRLGRIWQENCIIHFSYVLQQPKTLHNTNNDNNTYTI
jgi:translation elongation factor EF-Ts